MSTLGEQIKAMRLKKGMTQEQLAQKLGTTKAAISRYERNQRQPRLEQLSEIAQILEANPDNLTSLFYPSLELQDESGDRATIYLGALCNRIFAPGIRGISDSEDSSEADNLPPLFHELEEKEVVQKLLDVFLKLDRFWQQNVIEDAERYLEYQKQQENKIQKLKQDVE